jgi:hypothetical protein
LGDRGNTCKNAIGCASNSGEKCGNRHFILKVAARPGSFLRELNYCVPRALHFVTQKRNLALALDALIARETTSEAAAKYAFVHM